MTTDSFFAVMCGGLIGLLFGLVLAFAGYRLSFWQLPAFQEDFCQLPPPEWDN